MCHNESLYQAIAIADEKEQIAYCRHLCEQYLKTNPDHGPTLIRYADNLTSLAQYAEAQAALDHAQQIVSNDRLHFVLWQRGHLLQAQGDFIGAENLFMQAHELIPDDASSLIFAGSVAFRRGEIERAIHLARKATECSEGCVDEAWFNLGGYLLSTKRYHEAVDCYQMALKINPEYQMAKDRLTDIELIFQNVG